MGAERRMMVGRGPDYLPRVMEVDADGYLAGVGMLVTHVPQFNGAIWYVQSDAPAGGDGTTPDTPLATITGAIAAASAGDAIAVGSGTYDENGLDMSLDSLELWCEVGVVIANSAGATVLTVSGDYCYIRGPRCTQAGQTGFHITGTRCELDACKSGPGSSIGFDIDGSACRLRDCHAGSHTTTGYDIGANGCSIRDSSATGIGGATRGFYITGSAKRCRLWNCGSIGNATAGYEVTAGCSDVSIAHCFSGGSDGGRIDNGLRTTWPDYSFDDEIFHTTTFAGGGGGSDNIFKVSGCVEIHYIYGDVHTILSADVDNIYLDLWDGAVSVEITDNGGGGTDTNSADIGSVFIKSEIATTAITLLQSNQGRVEENTSFRLPRTPFILNQKKDTNTYIRVVYSGVATSGAIQWHCKWEPLTEDGFVEAA